MLMIVLSGFISFLLGFLVHRKITLNAHKKFSEHLDHVTPTECIELPVTHLGGDNKEYNELCFCVYDDQPFVQLFWQNKATGERYPYSFDIPYGVDVNSKVIAAFDSITQEISNRSKLNQ